MTHAVKTIEVPLSPEGTTLIDADDFEKLRDYRFYRVGHKNFKYVSIRKKKTSGITMLHRHLLNAPAHLQVDHINGNSLDNRQANLRLCTRLDNCRNRAKRFDSTSPYKGVLWNKQNKNWRVRIRVNWKPIEVGSFKTAEEAARAYNEAAVKYYGEFARINNV